MEIDADGALVAGRRRASSLRPWKRWRSSRLPKSFEIFVPDIAVADPGTHALLVPDGYKAKVAELAARFDLSPTLIEALVWQESRWRENAVSPVGARGLAQLMPGTPATLASIPTIPSPISKAARVTCANSSTGSMAISRGARRLQCRPRPRDPRGRHSTHSRNPALRGRHRAACPIIHGVIN